MSLVLRTESFEKSYTPYASAERNNLDHHITNDDYL